MHLVNIFIWKIINDQIVLSLSFKNFKNKTQKNPKVPKNYKHIKGGLK